MDRTILVVIAVVFATCAWARPGEASVRSSSRVLYVSPAGDDRNPGTISRPFRTIQRAADSVDPGDTVLVEDGTYTAASGTSCSGNPVMCLGRGGTSTAPVTFRARNAGAAKLYGQNGVSALGIAFNGAAYVTVDGFEIYGFAPNASAAAAAGVMIQRGHDIVLSRLHIHDIGRSCTDTTYGMVGVFIRVPHVTITRSLFHDIGRLSPGEQGCRPKTTYYQGNDHGIYVDGQRASALTPGASNVTVSNSIFYRHQRGWAIQLYPGILEAVRIENNTFAFPNPYRDGHILVGASTSNSIISNNIFYSPQSAAIDYYKGTQTNLQVSSNVVYNARLFRTTPGGAAVSGTIEANPLFVNAGSEPYDFHLMPGSPAIGAGVPRPAVTVDFSGAPRAGPIDVGAYQSRR